MAIPTKYDCIVIGHNEPPLEEYERVVRHYGAKSATYRDLKMSFVEIDGSCRPTDAV